MRESAPSEVFRIPEQRNIRQGNESRVNGLDSQRVQREVAFAELAANYADLKVKTAEATAEDLACMGILEAGKAMRQMREEAMTMSGGAGSGQGKLVETDEDADIDSLATQMSAIVRNKWKAA
ncbi:hypothetical protein FWD07_02475 [Candidatus Saccharibacteria bacterium]|nr:hypothetical protein [Candidatus Saccharibacteria bacterium]